MPIREGRAKLWFTTKEEQDEYDDRLISNIELTSDVDTDENYAMMFCRSKKESFLTLNDRAQKELSELRAISHNKIEYINKYLAGKRDHSIDRHWNIQKGLFAWGVGYLLLRELPIRNFYARSSIFILAFYAFYERKMTILPWKPVYHVQQDEFTDKDIRNYQAYTDMTAPIIPSANNKIPEGKLWQLNQPAYLREYPQAKIGEIGSLLFAPKEKVVAWDGTFNQPLAGLAHPLHKDAKNIDFVWWEY